jgi:hypothetical protein
MIIGKKKTKNDTSYNSEKGVDKPCSARMPIGHDNWSGVSSQHGPNRSSDRHTITQWPTGRFLAVADSWIGTKTRFGGSGGFLNMTQDQIIGQGGFNQNQDYWQLRISEHKPGPIPLAVGNC